MKRCEDVTYKHIYDVEYIENIIDQFIEAVSQQPEQAGKPVSFTNGYMDRTEGYKYAAYVKATDILDVKRWKLSKVKTGEIAERAIRAMNINENNFVFKSQKILFRDKTMTDPEETGQLIYNLFTNNDDEANLEALAAFFGRRYDIISYLFYLKDPNTYFPCKPRWFRKAFELLGIETDSLDSCTYDNYVNYNESLKELATLYSVYAGHISTLDAHSFAWAVCNHKEIYEFIFCDANHHDEDDSVKKEGLTTAKIRLNQSEFRYNVVSYWDGKCSVTCCGMTDILEAAHIKSWRDCKYNAECISAYNGLLLTPNMHKLFDNGLISFGPDGRIMISDRLPISERQVLGIDESLKLRVVDPKRESFLSYHRENIFR